ncbi:SURF1 family protein [Paracoccus albus]|uniref:SURF1 family protein n=1 Tax=Paracoccus albus TaxID=3017784 RepID=UPI0022F0ED2A|nr:SURF1 family protein [Paracoccus albus]WBU61299.1 SURF1 family protein [Paracoccus albus]
MSRDTEDSIRPLWQMATVLTLGLLMLAGFLWLGFWQVDRLAWKRQLIANVDERVHAAPIDWAELTTQPPAQQEYRRVQVTGIFDHDKETLVQAVTELGGGFWVLTPMLTGSGKTVLVNRGFVPPEKRNAAERAEGQISGPQTIVGLARLSEPGGAFLRSNNPSEDRWYSRDIDAIANARQLDQPADFFIDADATPNPGGYPVGGLTVINFRNTHLSYALTWFALALMVAVGIVLLIRHEISARRR